MSRNACSAAWVAAAVTLATATAHAADIPQPVRKAAPVVTAYDWSGFYIGGHLGAGLSGNWSGTTAREPVNPVQWNLSFDQNASGFIGGGQLGYNWHIAPQWVVGIEADLSATSLNDSSWISPVPSSVGPIVGAFASMQRDVEWIGTVRGRVGHAWDRWLLYMTGGFAFGQVSYAGDVNFIALGGAAFPTSFRSTQLGWTAGAGVEYALPTSDGRWTLRGEYLYYALEAAESTPPSVPFAPGVTSHFRWNETTIHALRLGVNYKFGSAAPRY